jgi:hypothetical protein
MRSTCIVHGFLPLLQSSVKQIRYFDMAQHQVASPVSSAAKEKRYRTSEELIIIQCYTDKKVLGVRYSASKK